MVLVAARETNPRGRAVGPRSSGEEVLQAGGGDPLGERKDPLGGVQVPPPARDAGEPLGRRAPSLREALRPLGPC